MWGKKGEDRKTTCILLLLVFPPPERYQQIAGENPQRRRHRQGRRSVGSAAIPKLRQDPWLHGSGRTPKGFAYRKLGEHKFVETNKSTGNQKAQRNHAGVDFLTKHPKMRSVAGRPADSHAKLGVAGLCQPVQQKTLNALHFAVP